MFAAYCQLCDAVVLLGSGNVHAVANTADGIVVRFTCHAGHAGTKLTGRSAAAAARAGAGTWAGGGRRSRLVRRSMAATRRGMVCSRAVASTRIPAALAAAAVTGPITATGTPRGGGPP